MASLKNSTTVELLRTYADVIEELRAREVVRSKNNPVADYAETLVCRAVQGVLQPKSNKSFDILGADGKRYEVKARRITADNGSRQLGALRQLEKQPFDFLAGVLFNADFSIMRAAIVPWKIVFENATHVSYTNAWKFMLRDSVWSMSGVRDLKIDV